ncbi:TPA: hypothetical protein PXC30_001729 [Staphylococcus aureus]|uniref:hypothetical protein n=1 Tax=Staphylococcus aureus TaxID=1280 RepID=UPI0002C69AB1|nr:hypothetical protein [Staphylococcus aureus]CCW21696.1 hypothetical protein transposon-related [Staphylococcus aureus M1]HCU7511599.1 hypothetical protein [Staphylococcus aureus]HCU7828068.1 hypothetical protein [Staphylococcus aureus]HCU8019131.1 hypothetical protein [Staphylococcus aureus]HCU9110376.1 hypothetical protein [Staphylococcus aureus]
MDYYTADRLYRYTNSSNLSEPILNYVASRINWGDKVSLMTLAKEIQSKFNDSYVKENTVKGRPKIYADLCLLCMSLSEAGYGRMLQVNLEDCIYIGDIDV